MKKIFANPSLEQKLGVAAIGISFGVIILLSDIKFSLPVKIALGAAVLGGALTVHGWYKETHTVAV